MSAWETFIRRLAIASLYRAAEREKDMGMKITDEMAGVRVRKLEWDKYDDAFGVCCKYMVYQTGDGWNCVKYPSGDSPYRLAEGVSEHKARAAAQADYEACIMAALEGVEASIPQAHLAGREAAIRKAGQVVIDDLIDRGGWCIASDDDLADYMTRIVDACVRAALATEGK